MKSKKRIDEIPRTEGEIVAALMPLEPIHPAAVPEAGGTDIAVYDGQHRGLRIKALENAAYAGVGFAAALLFLFVLMPVTTGAAALLLAMMAAVGLGLGLWKGADFVASARQLHGHDPRLYLPAGMTEADARFENHARMTVDAWNRDASWRDVEAGDVGRRYVLWRDATFNHERLSEGLTPEAAFAELDTMARERTRLEQAALDKAERAKLSAELSNLFERWMKRTFDEARLAEEGFTPAQARLEFDAFRIEAARVEEQSADLRRRREKIVVDLGRFAQRALKAGEREAKLLPAPEEIDGEE